MEYSTWFSDELNVTGSELSWSHYAADKKASTYNIDFGSNGSYSRNRYAPFTCRVKFIDTRSNAIYCESVDKVICPRCPQGDYLCFQMCHFDKMPFKVGDIIKQGALIGTDGTFSGGKTGGVARHLHMMFGTGKLNFKNGLSNAPVVPRGQGKDPDGKFNGGKYFTVYSLACTTWIHCYDFMFIKPNCKITTNPAWEGAKYKWTTLPSSATAQIATVTGEVLKKEGDIYTIKATSVK